MRTARVVAVAAAVALAFTLASAPVRAGDPAVEKLAADWAAAFAKGDVKNLAALYTENAIRVTPEGGRVVGREAIGKEFAANFAGPWKGAAIKITVGELQPVSPDIAVGEGTYEVTGVKGPDGSPMPAIKGTYINTLVKKNGAWMLASNAAVLPAPPPAPPKK
jgi:uncharacterized protein (TIGR02246 family)